MKSAAPVFADHYRRASHNRPMPTLAIDALPKKTPEKALLPTPPSEK
jgi:hypothetical protein